MLKQIREHFLKAFDRLEEKYVELIREQIGLIDHKAGHGAPEWESMVQNAVKRVYKQVTASYIEYAIGIPYREGTKVTAAASIYEFGVGDKADPAAESVHTKPGQEVWKDDLSRGPSTAETEYMIDQFNQEGSFYIENATKLMDKYFDDILSDACMQMPDSIIYSNIKSTVR